MFTRKRPTIGLALGGGGSKGLAHIGVIKVLEENNIPIDFIAGTSIGALVGGFYAVKKNISEIEEIATKNTWKQLFSLFFDPSLTQGLVKGDKIERFIDGYVGDITFDKLKIPFTAVATDLTTAEPVYLSSGDVSSAIRASIALPFLIRPVVLDGRLLTDGGTTVPVPVTAVAKMGADIVIAVNLHEHYVGLTASDKFGLQTITSKAFSILGRHLARENANQADVVVAPIVGEYGLFDRFFGGDVRTQEVIKAGENAMKDKLPELQKILTTKQKPSDLRHYFQPVAKLVQSIKKIVTG